ncbi:NAD(P)-binding domain-containing protein [Kutzneria viridogrisea]|uniref:Flavin-containing monooxygenase 5 n=1 Tax=Kutzneria viridogrisea TaxID=47990 RepID=A0ABR6BEH2_9PSEU|nr:cation diffusion facilitator CzcD-associated flavoprotein CzcO [Kutzneria viridogrisea]
MGEVCIIGAGSSGIAACQVLAERGIGFDCFEVGSEVGGNWRYGNDNNMSSAYRSLHINTSRQLMQYASYPMAEDLPAYPSHFQIARYFDDFVDHFGLRERITFRTEVTAVRPAPGGGYEVTTRQRDCGTEHTEHYHSVLVANGHHWNPRWPDPAFPGADTFTGEQVHSHHYREFQPYVGKRVLVLGIGNSACDIAVETSRVAERTFLAMRRGAHILPKYLFGVPTDHLTTSPVAKGPFWLRRLTLRLLLAVARGRVTGFGLPEPDHKVLSAHPTISDDLLTRLGHGDIAVRPNIARFEGDTVHFVDGSSERIDVVVYCTGYRITFPFLDESVITSADNEVALFHRVVPPDHPGLYFLGLIQPLGAIMPLAEAQSHWIADLIQGRVRLPGTAAMHREIREYRAALRRRYVSSKRHTIQVDFLDYLAELRRARAVDSRPKPSVTVQ